MENPKELVVEDRRQASRFGKERETDFALVVQPDGSYVPVEVHDESLGGIALRVESEDAFHVHQQIVLVYLQQSHQATVRHINKHGDGYVVVGLSCERIG